MIAANAGGRSREVVVREAAGLRRLVSDQPGQEAEVSVVAAGLHQRGEDAVLVALDRQERW